MEVEITKKDGSRLSKADFEVVRKEIVALASRPQGVQPEEILELARDTTNPLHKFFEWDDAKAAERYRLEQARKLIYTVQIRVIEDGEEPIRGSFAVRVIDIEDGRRSYRPLQDVMNDPEQRALLVQRALDEYEAWQTRYQNLAELSELFEAGNALKRKIEVASRKVMSPPRRRRR